MSYNCVVLVKQVPDTKRITGRAMNDDGTVNRALPAIFNPEDLNAGDGAGLGPLRRAGDDHDGIACGDGGVARHCIAATRPFRLRTAGVRQSDTLATSYILAVRSAS